MKKSSKILLLVITLLFSISILNGCSTSNNPYDFKILNKESYTNESGTNSWISYVMEFESPTFIDNNGGSAFLSLEIHYNDIITKISPGIDVYFF